MNQRVTNQYDRNDGYTFPIAIVRKDFNHLFWKRIDKNDTINNNKELTSTIRIILPLSFESISLYNLGCHEEFQAITTTNIHIPILYAKEYIPACPSPNIFAINNRSTCESKAFERTCIINGELNASADIKYRTLNLNTAIFLVSSTHMSVK